MKTDNQPSCSLTAEQVFLAFIAADPNAPHWSRVVCWARWEQASSLAYHIEMLTSKDDQP